MPFRERVKRVLGRSSSSNSSSSSLHKKDSVNRSDSSIWYQPGEKMPPMKYRRPVAKEHKEKLEAFTFAKAWRRRSQQSQYSPMGSRYPSRRNSLTSRKSMQQPTRQVIEDLDDAGDVKNVGLSPQRTREDGRYLSANSSSTQRGSEPATSSRPETATTNSSCATPGFTQQDLNLALKRSRIENHV